MSEVLVPPGWVQPPPWGISKRGETEVSLSIKFEAETERLGDLDNTGLSWHFSKPSRIQEILACMGQQLMHRILLQVAGAGAS